ncbi:hypothetical protein BU24DRAFT_497620 [Aaosphaeria arxii CBS 175.79]|uniref:Uncharacterized protein n=1 Tax=Aaosphaeria arxii CBS 175.79 TaxID=1450172 RepID=A0A6A5X834_9PLEO|nr:uncharacterized protein BU24DRAFT_497620 [Aaosphaeria arxii CBS 175.79]KAF2009066.1 hypothetical protein BU24DRAFT_497620 [Aaosphaeria arxii CBS 175.79]
MLAIALLGAATVVAADVTTSIWLPKDIYGSNRIGFVGSVIGADNDTLTVAMGFDNETHPDIRTAFEAQVWTFGPTAIQTFTTDLGVGAIQSLVESITYSGDWSFGWNCSRDSQGDASCTTSAGIHQASIFACRMPRPVEVFTILNTFSRGSTGDASTETLIVTDPGTPNTVEPDFCSVSGNDFITSIPIEYAVQSSVVRNSDISTYKVVITAGEELLTATAGATLSTPGPQATATGTSNQTQTGTSQPTVSEFTGAASPMMTAAPGILGLGAAIAAFAL